jgi:cytochrome c-type biogenesis protein CcmH/NrfF
MSNGRERSDINISRLFVGGIGGVGLVIMAGFVAYFLEPLRWPAVIAIVGGAALGLSLIAIRHRPARRYAIAGLVLLALSVLITIYLRSTVPIHAQSVSEASANVSAQLNDLTRRVGDLEGDVKRQTTGAMVFLFGAFCALWAQNTKRDPWLWFFLGAFFNVFAVISLLIKNAEGQGRNAEADTGMRWVTIGGFLILILLTFALLFWTSYR